MKWRKLEHKRIALILVGLCFLVLVLNSYFNFISGNTLNEEGESLGTRYYLSGPDPYYNMRLCEETLEKGYYPYLSPEQGDPLLNYPLGVRGGARPPLFNLIAVGTTKLIEPVVGETDGLGLSMLFLPAIYGAILVFPIYGIGKELFDRRAGLIAAALVPLIPAHIGSGHGSALSLFDHDSFVLLLFAITFYFTIKALKEKDNKRYFFAGLAGLTIGALQMTWVAAQVILLLLMAYMVVQFFLTLWKSNYDMSGFYVTTIIFGVAFFVSAPYFIIKDIFIHYPLILFGASLLITGVVLIYRKLNLPGTLSIPISVLLGGTALAVFYSAHIGIIQVRALEQIGAVFFGAGIYGSKVSLTIGEAHTASLSVIAMSIGPLIYYGGILGLLLFMYKTYISKWPKENVFFIVVALVQLWMVTNAGRFLNDTIPVLVVFTGFITATILIKLDYKRLFSNMRRARSIKPMKAVHIFGILYVIVGLILPNTYLALDAAVPPSMDQQVFGENFSGYFGNSVSEQVQWSYACEWLATQDTAIEKPEDRPGVISWWDYGFYIASMAKHPTVAENYQHGIPCAANFHTALTEKEANAVLIIRLMEGTKRPITKATPVGTITNEQVDDVLLKYFDQNTTSSIINMMEDPEQYAPSYETSVYKNSTIKIDGFNAMYQDITAILVTLPDLALTELYLDMAKATDSIIRYYGIEQRDITNIFGVFPFLADKGIHGYEGFQDEWFTTVYVDTNTGEEFTYEEVLEMNAGELQRRDFSPKTERQPNFYNSFIYKNYFGAHDNYQIPDNKIPAYFLRHWKLVYNSPYISITKYYAGAPVTGTVAVDNISYDGAVVYVMDENGIPHDFDTVQNGHFAVIVPAGNITLHVGMGSTLLDEKINIGKVTDEEAMLEVPYEKDVSFSLSYGELDISIAGLNETAMLHIQSTHYPTLYNYSINASNQNFTYNQLLPDTYTISLVNQTNATIYYKEIFIQPNDNILEIVGEDFGY